MMKRDMIEITSAVMGGLGIGAMAMYLFDPEKGMGRRKMVRDEAQHMAGKASCAIHQAGQTLRQGKAQLKQRAAQWMPSSMSDESSCPVRDAALTAGPIVGALALGAGLMFLLDPISGRQRRSSVRSKAAQYTRGAGDTLSSTRRRVSEKARGMYQGAKEMVGHHEHNGGHRLGAVEEHGQAIQ